MAVVHLHTSCKHFELSMTCVVISLHVLQVGLPASIFLNTSESFEVER